MRYLIIISVLLSFACSKEIGPQYIHEDTGDISTHRKVLCLNEGNFQWGNSSISIYSPQNKNVQHFIYRNTNQNKPLGDVAQSMALYQGLLYVVVNNSGKIVVLDTATFQEKYSITGFTSPRYISFYKNKAFVSDLYANTIHIINLNTHTISGKINVNGHTEFISTFHEKILISNQNKLLIINPIQENIDTALTFSSSIEKHFLDKNGNLWLLCKGNHNTVASLHQLNTNFDIIKTLTFEALASPQFLNINSQKDKLYYASNKAIWEIDINTNVLPTQALIHLQDKNIYALNVDPISDDIYLSDAVDFVQSSQLYRYNSEGKLLDSFEGGIITNQFLFP